MRSARPPSRPQGLAWLKAAIGLAAWAALTVGPAEARPADLVAVSLDKAKLLRYPPSTETIVLGNPIIADVTMLRGSGTLVLTGKSFGETNLVLLDRAGNIVGQLDVRVEPPSNLLTVQRGMDRESYSCAPRCQPTVSLGDAGTFLTGTIESVSKRNGLATPQGPAAVAGPH